MAFWRADGADESLPPSPRTTRMNLEYDAMMLELASLDARLPDERHAVGFDRWSTDALEAEFARDPMPPQRKDGDQ